MQIRDASRGVLEIGDFFAGIAESGGQPFLNFRNPRRIGATLGFTHRRIAHVFSAFLFVNFFSFFLIFFKSIEKIPREKRRVPFWLSPLEVVEVPVESTQFVVSQSIFEFGAYDLNATPFETFLLLYSYRVSHFPEFKFHTSKNAYTYGFFLFSFFS